MKKRQLTTKKPPTERIITDIRTLRDNGKLDEEIRNLLGIELRTYQRHTKTIYEQDQQVWFSITQEQLGSELLRMKQSLEETYKIAKEMALDSKCEDRIDWLNTMNDSRLNIVKLLIEYPEFINASKSNANFDEQGSTNTIKPYVKRVHS